MKTMQKISGIAGALVITAGMVAGFATNAEAAPPAGSVETRSVAVSYADLDLNRGAGVQALYQRLRVAAKRACGSYDTRDRIGRASVQACREAALTDAVARLGNERVAWFHSAGGRGAKAPPQRIAGRD